MILKLIKLCGCLIGNMIEVFFEIDSQGKRPPCTSRTATLEQTEALGSQFEQIDVLERGFYVALDKNYEKIFVVFGSGLRLVYGDEIGDYVCKGLCWNIEEYASINPPTIPEDSQHEEYEKWLLSNPHLCWPPWARAGVYHWGIWMERGHPHLGSIITKDTNVPVRMKQVAGSLFKAFGVLTRAQRILLAAVDLECMKEYEDICKECPPETRRLFQTDERECFTLRACLVNVFTEPHVDGGDVKNGWASMCPLGEFRNGDFCITEMKRRFVYNVGAISFLKSQQFEYFTLKWSGYRYCMVAAIHEAVKRELYGKNK